MGGVRADVGAVVPAALALRVRARGRDDRLVGVRRDARDLRRRREQREPQVVAEAGQRIEALARRADLDLGRERGADLPRHAQRLELLLHLGLRGPDRRPPREQIGGVVDRRERVPGVEEHAVVRALPLQHPPRLLGGERQDRRHQAEQARGDVPQRVLRRAPRRGIGAAGVEPVLEDVEVERAEVLGAERLQLLRHEVELVAVVVRRQLVLQPRGERDGVPVDLDPLGNRQRVARGVEVGEVREQEAQRVADAPVALDDALQDLVGDRRARPSSRWRRPTAAGSPRRASRTPAAAR